MQWITSCGVLVGSAPEQWEDV